MNTNNPSGKPEDSSNNEYELVVSSGGPAAALCGAGTLLAAELAGIRWTRIGGVSGGAIITSLAASGASASDLIQLTLESEYGHMITAKTGYLGAIAKLFGFNRTQGEEYPGVMHTGLFGSENLGNFIRLNYNRLAAKPDVWPAKYWTMATTKDGSQVIFNADGVTLITSAGHRIQLSDKPVPLGIAVRASSAIPGILAAVNYQGIPLFDGAMSRDGLCPVGVKIRHFGAEPRKIIACRVGEDSLSPVSGRLHRLARRVWQVHPEFHWGEETAGVIEFRPPIEHVHTLKFGLSRDEKWLAIAVAFESALATFALQGILHGEQLSKAQEILLGFAYWRDERPAALGARQILSERIERCLSQHGLFFAKQP